MRFFTTHTHPQKQPKHTKEMINRRPTMSIYRYFEWKVVFFLDESCRRKDEEKTERNIKKKI